MGGGGFEALASAGIQNAQAQEKQRIQEKQQQRNTVAALYLNAVNTPLPKTDDPAYPQALQKREDLMKQYVAAVGPEQHASFGQRLHGLIFGEPETAQPVHGNAPEPPAPTGQAPAPPVASQPQSNHPFSHNPAYAKIQEGLAGLGKHLSAFKNPLPPQAGPDYATLAAAPTEEERTIAEQERKEKAATDLEKMKDQAALERAQLLAGSKQLSTPEKAFLNRWAIQHGKEDFASLSTDDQESALSAFKQTTVNPSPKLQHIAGNWYEYDPATKKRTFLAKDADTRVSTGTHFITNQLTGEITAVPYTTVVNKANGQPIAGTTDNPGEVIEGATDSQPKSSQAPALSANPGARPPGAKPSGGAVRSKPKSSTAPVFGHVVGHTASLLDKADAAQYKKVADDANAKKEAYEFAQKSIQEGSTPSSDQHLIYAWVRSNVQGAGRMTQAEFRQAASIGSLDQRAQNWYDLTLKGTLSPDIEKMLFADIQRSYQVSQKTADDLRHGIGAGSPVSSQAPQVPTSTAPPVDQNLLNKLNSALSGGS